MFIYIYLYIYMYIYIFIYIYMYIYMYIYILRELPSRRLFVLKLRPGPPNSWDVRRFWAILTCWRFGLFDTRLDFPPLVQDVDSSTFEDETFSHPLWRRPNAADGAGSIRLRGGPGCSSAYVTHEARKRCFLQQSSHHIFDWYSLLQLLFTLQHKPLLQCAG